MNQTSKLCCDWRKLIWDCLAKPDQSEWFKVVQGWYRCGKINVAKFSIEFDCEECQQFFIRFFSDNQSMEQKMETMKQMGCCQLLPMIYDLDDNTVPEAVEFYNSVFADLMCKECQEVINLAKQKQLYEWIKKKK